MIEHFEQTTDSNRKQWLPLSQPTAAARRIAIRDADLEAARTLWRQGDWNTYAAVRDTLLFVLRSEYPEPLSKQNIQFIYFVNTLARPRCGNTWGDEDVFSGDRALPF